MQKEKDKLVGKMVENYLDPKSKLDYLAPDKLKKELTGTFDICSAVLSSNLKEVFGSAKKCVDAGKPKKDLSAQISSLEPKIRKLTEEGDEIQKKIDRNLVKFDLKILRENLVANMFTTLFLYANSEEIKILKTVAAEFPRLEAQFLSDECASKVYSLMEESLNEMLSIPVKVIIKNEKTQFGPANENGVNENYLVDLGNFSQKFAEIKIPTFDKIGKLVPAVSSSELSKQIDGKGMCQILQNYNGCTEFPKLKPIEKNQTVESYLIKQGFTFGKIGIEYSDIINRVKNEKESIIIVSQDKTFYCHTPKGKGPEQDISILKPVLDLGKNNCKVFYQKEANLLLR